MNPLLFTVDFLKEKEKEMCYCECVPVRYLPLVGDSIGKKLFISPILTSPSPG